MAYSGVQLITQVLSFGQNFIVRLLLQPSIMGVWNYIGVVQGFLGTFDLGINSAAFRELPLLHGKKEYEEEAQARSTAFWSGLGQGSVFMVGAIIYLLVRWKQIQQKEALFVAALLVVFSAMKESLITFHQGAQLYLPLSRILLLTGLCQAFLFSFGAFIAGLKGLIISAILVQAIQIALFLKSSSIRGISIRCAWRWRIFKRQVGFGIPFRIVDYPLSLFLMLDVIFITRFLNTSALAIYMTARVIYSLVVEIIARVGTVIISRLNELGGTVSGRQKIGKELHLFLLFNYSFLMPGLICLGYFCSSLMIAQFIPKYADSLPVLRILLAAVYFVPQATIVRNYWILDKRFRSLAISNLIGFTALLTILFVSAHSRPMNLETVAWATLSGYSIYYLYIMLSIGRKIWGIKSALGLSLLAFISAASAIITIRLRPVNLIELNFLEALGKTSFNLIQAILLLSPLMIYGLWRLLRSGSFPSLPGWIGIKSIVNKIAGD